MIKKLAVVFCLMASPFLSGCVAVGASTIFANIGYVKTGMDVISYATTSKGTTDHAISAYTKKDCALHRIVVGKKMCKLTEKQLVKKLAQELEDANLNMMKSQAELGFKYIDLVLIPQLDKDIAKSDQILAIPSTGPRIKVKKSTPIQKQPVRVEPKLYNFREFDESMLKGRGGLIPQLAEDRTKNERILRQLAKGYQLP